MKATELRKKKPAELTDKLLELLRDQFNLRMQKGVGQLGQPSEIKRVRRDIARLKTVIHERSI